MMLLQRYGIMLVLVAALAGCASTDNGAQSLTPSGPAAFEVDTQQVGVAAVEERMRQQFSSRIQQLVAQNQTASRSQT